MKRLRQILASSWFFVVSPSEFLDRIVLSGVGVAACYSLCQLSQQGLPLDLELTYPPLEGVEFFWHGVDLNAEL